MAVLGYPHEDKSFSVSAIKGYCSALNQVFILKRMDLFSLQEKRSTSQEGGWIPRPFGPDASFGGWLSPSCSFMPDFVDKTQNPPVPNNRFSVPSLQGFVDDDTDEVHCAQSGLSCFIWGGLSSLDQITDAFSFPLSVIRRQCLRTLFPCGFVRWSRWRPSPRKERTHSFGIELTKLGE